MTNALILSEIAVFFEKCQRTNSTLGLSCNFNVEILKFYYKILSNHLRERNNFIFKMGKPIFYLIIYFSENL